MWSLRHVLGLRGWGLRIGERGLPQTPLPGRLLKVEALRSYLVIPWLMYSTQLYFPQASCPKYRTSPWSATLNLGWWVFDSPNPYKSPTSYGIQTIFLDSRERISKVWTASRAPRRMWETVERDFYHRSYIRLECNAVLGEPTLWLGSQNKKKAPTV